MAARGAWSLFVAVVLGQVVPGLGEGLRLLVEDGVAARAVPLPTEDVVSLLRGVALLAPLLILGGVDEKDHIPLGFRVRHRGKVRRLGFRSTKRGIRLCNTIALDRDPDGAGAGLTPARSP
jgi:hypothetical protein